MDPIYQEVHQIQLIVENGCANDEITNIGDPVDGSFIPTNYIYYINEETEQTALTQGTSIPFHPTLKASFQTPLLAYASSAELFLLTIFLS